MTAQAFFLLENAWPLVTMNPDREILERGWVAARDGLIVAVGSGSAPDVIDGVDRADWSRTDAAG
ncbi:MAG: hypothetical protein ABIF77_10680, partial [bacterium]